jgi:multiple antibiotic resistance protein
MFDFSLKVFVTFFTVVDPIGLVPFVIGLLGQYSDKERVRIITRSVLIAAIVLAVFGAFGQFIFNSLGITIYAFNIAGGILLFLVAFDMLFGRPSGARETPAEQEEARSREDVSVFPLAIPLIAGPGTIATIILLVSNAGNDTLKLGAIGLAALITLFIAWIAMRTSILIEKRIGTTGIMVLSRILGMILAALAIQFILNGLSTFWLSLNH